MARMRVIKSNIKVIKMIYILLAVLVTEIPLLLNLAIIIANRYGYE